MRALRFLLSAIFGLIGFLLASAGALAAGLAQFGRNDLEADILAHFAPLFLLAALLGGLLGWLALRRFGRWAVVTIAAAGVVAAGALIGPELTRSTGPKAGREAPDQLKVIQFNVWRDNPEIARTVDWIVAQGPDVLIVEEASDELRALIEARTGWRPACQRCDTTIYSRLPMAGARRIKGDGPLLTAELRDSRGSFPVVVAHNAWPTDGDDQQRQEARLADLLKSLPQDRAIAAGDFNSAPWSFSRRRWDAEFGLIRRERALFTWPARPYKRLTKVGAFPFLPIDHVYAGKGWATVSVKRGPRLGSDHYPVVMVLAPVSPGSAAPR